MAEFVKKELYDSLIKERTKLIEVLEDSRGASVNFNKKIKEDESFLSDYDNTKLGIEKSIANINSQKVTFESEVANNVKSIDTLAEEISTLNSTNEDLAKQIEKLRKEEDPKGEIPALEKQVKANESVVLTKKNSVTALKIRNEKLEELIRDGEVSKSEFEEQLALNADRKDELESGELDDLKEALARTNEDVTKKEDEYSKFIDASKVTIATYEAQEDVRSRVIKSSNTRSAYNRALPKEQNDVIASEFEVINSVIAVELSTENEDEAELRKEAIESGRSQEINPDYLSKDQAAALTRSALFSTKRVASLIKDAALRGFSSVTVDDLTNSEIYALNQAGYVVVTTTSENNLMIMWGNIEKEEK